MTNQLKIKKYPIEFDLRSYDCDFSGKASIPALFRYMSDAAWKSAEKLGFGFSHLKAKNLFWVLVRLKIRMESYPKWGDTLVINTWPTGRDKLYCYRDFEIADSSGKVMGKAASAWLALDFDTRRPCRTADFYEVETDHPGNVFPDPLKKIRGKSNEAQLNKPYQVHLSDLDIHSHVNNSIYVRWVMDGFTKSFTETHELRELEINFISETQEQDQVELKTLDMGLEQRHHIVKSGEETELCRARTVWAD